MSHRHRLTPTYVGQVGTSGVGSGDPSRDPIIRLRCVPTPSTPTWTSCLRRDEMVCHPTFDDTIYLDLWSWRVALLYTKNEGTSGQSPPARGPCLHLRRQNLGTEGSRGTRTCRSVVTFLLSSSLLSSSLLPLLYETTSLSTDTRSEPYHQYWRRV